MQELTTPIVPLNYFLQHFNIAGLFVLLLLEEAGIPLPLPGDLLIFVAGTQARLGKSDFLQVVGIVFAATLLGASILYLISRFLARPVIIKLLRFVRVDEARIKKASGQVLKRGGVAVVVGRLTPGFRTITSVAAGILKFPYYIFAPYTGIAAIIWAIIYFLLGFYAGPTALSILQVIGKYFATFVILVIFLAVAGFFYLRRKRAVS